MSFPSHPRSRIPFPRRMLHSALSMSFPLSAAAIIAQAHPTPLCTSIAWTGQFRAHAPHSMHDDGLGEHRVFISLSKYPVGADLGAAPAVDTPLLVITERVLRIGVKHQITPRIFAAPRTIESTTPDPAMNHHHRNVPEDLGFHARP